MFQCYEILLHLLKHFLRFKRYHHHPNKYIVIDMCE